MSGNPTGCFDQNEKAAHEFLVFLLPNPLSMNSQAPVKKKGSQ